MLLLHIEKLFVPNLIVPVDPNPVKSNLVVPNSNEELL